MVSCPLLLCLSDQRLFVVPLLLCGLCPVGGRERELVVGTVKDAQAECGPPEDLSLQSISRHCQYIWWSCGTPAKLIVLDILGGSFGGMEGAERTLTPTDVDMVTVFGGGV